MARQRKTAVAKTIPPAQTTAIVVAGFDYSQLEGELAEQVRETAQRIRERVKTTLVSIIEVGRDLLGVKEATLTTRLHRARKRVAEILDPIPAR